MPAIYQNKIFRADLKANPDRIYVFGDNLVRRGFGGQAAEMRGEPNSVGVATKKYPARTPNAYFYDAEYDSNIANITSDFEPIFAALKAGKTVVFPAKGIGTGLSKTENTAPKTFAYLNSLIKRAFNPQSERPKLRLRRDLSGKIALPSHTRSTPPSARSLPS